MEYRKLIEGLLYVQGEVGITPRDLKYATNMPTFNARKQLKMFMEEFNNLNRGIMVVEFDDVFKFVTRKELKDDITKVIATKTKQRLSNAAIETIGIIAYKQPVTKSQINEIRGIASEAVVNTLLLKKLIEEKGIAKTPGNPILYGLTNKFYDYFQIKSLNELPKMSDIDESEGVDDDFELYSSQRSDN